MISYNKNYIDIIENSINQYCASKRTRSSISIPFESYEKFLRNTLFYSNKIESDRIRYLLFKINTLKNNCN